MVSSNPHPDSESSSESWETHCSCEAVRWGSRYAPQSQVLTWGLSCSCTPSFCPARDPKHGNGFVRVGCGNSLATHMADGAMHKTHRHTRGTQPPVTIIGLMFLYRLSHASGTWWWDRGENPFMLRQLQLRSAKLSTEQMLVLYRLQEEIGSCMCCRGHSLLGDHWQMTMLSLPLK